MAEISPKWAQKRRGHVWDCTKRIYIRFVQFPVIHGFVSEIMKIQEYHEKHEIFIKSADDAKGSVVSQEIRENDWK